MILSNDNTSPNKITDSMPPYLHTLANHPDPQRKREMNRFISAIRTFYTHARHTHTDIQLHIQWNITQVVLSLSYYNFTMQLIELLGLWNTEQQQLWSFFYWSAYDDIWFVSSFTFVWTISVRHIKSRPFFYSACVSWIDLTDFESERIVKNRFGHLYETENTVKNTNSNWIIELKWNNSVLKRLHNFHNVKFTKPMF